MQRLLMNEAELQILFNLLGDQLTVEYPLFDFDLFVAKPQGNYYEFETRGNEKEFDQSLSSYPEYIDELPEYHDYVDCMLSSGVIEYDNLNKFNHLFGQIRKWPETKQACYCPDTNIFYHRFFSNFSKIKANEVVLIKTIEEEIKAALSHKYNPQITDIFKALNTTQKRLFDEIIDRHTKNARRAAYLAQREFRKIKHGALEVLSGVDESKPDNDYNDAIIVKTACQAKQDRYEFLYLLTAGSSHFLIRFDNVPFIRIKSRYSDTLRLQIPDVSWNITRGSPKQYLFKQARLLMGSFCSKYNVRVRNLVECEGTSYAIAVRHPELAKFAQKKTIHFDNGCTLDASHGNPEFEGPLNIMQELLSLPERVTELEKENTMLKQTILELKVFSNDMKNVMNELKSSIVEFKDMFSKSKHPDEKRDVT